MQSSLDSSEPPRTIEEAIELCQSSPTLRKIKAYLDSTNLSADLKALLYDVAGFTIKIGEAVVAIGRRIFGMAMWLVDNMPNTLLGVAVALAVTTLVGAIPMVGAGLALLLNKLLLLIGVTAGAIEDIRQHAMKDAMDRFAAQFAVFSTVQV
ncbi:hypothetical protein [Paracoccus versutus]|uniref:Uncharacterized protein n=1 Tax=Paracoccus versutus TaxID=34007 RepID=A0A3D9XW71_PARVE|nr:hypothetical protein [Paracoccus versutus]REF72482.1 hypothetical protein BDD41_0958 [Paracoccus versutus]WGR55562.1 hypothetical protein E3U25_06105 [Paracoccus versutus]